jgi:hypothetical protein
MFFSSIEARIICWTSSRVNYVASNWCGTSGGTQQVQYLKTIVCFYLPLTTIPACKDDGGFCLMPFDSSGWFTIRNREWNSFPLPEPSLHPAFKIHAWFLRSRSFLLDDAEFSRTAVSDLNY